MIGAGMAGLAAARWLVQTMYAAHAGTPVELGPEFDNDVLHQFHALLAAELADTAGWDLLVQIAKEAGDRDAKKALEKRRGNTDGRLDGLSGMKVLTIPLLLLGFTGVAAAAPAKQPLLGIAPLQISPELREHFGAPHDRGVLVDRVQPDSPAAHAGIAVGDVVTDVAGSEAQSVRDIQSAVAEHKPGDTLDIAVVRDHKPVQLHATLDAKFTREAPPFEGAPFENDSFDSEIQRMMDMMRHMQEQQHQQQQLPPSGQHT